MEDAKVLWESLRYACCLVVSVLNKIRRIGCWPHQSQLTSWSMLLIFDHPRSIYLSYPIHKQSMTWHMKIRERVQKWRGQGTLPQYWIQLDTISSMEASLERIVQWKLWRYKVLRPFFRETSWWTINDSVLWCLFNHFPAQKPAGWWF